jgi:UDP-glucose 4-epimerase
MDIDGRRVLVTGGAGFIGSSVVDLLAPRAELVRVVDDLSAGRLENLADASAAGTVEFVEADVRDRDAMLAACQGIDAVLHLAVSCLRVSLYSPWESHDVNAGGTLATLEAALESGVERFLYCSSSEVYGTALHAPMDESHPTLPTTVYGGSKLAGEAYALAFWQTHGLPVVVVRPFNTYGYREHHEGPHGEVIPKMVARALNGLPPLIFGDGSQSRDFTFVTDSARGIVEALSSDELVGDVVNVAFGREISIRSIADAVCALCAPELEPVFDEPRPADVRRHFANIEKARRVLGFEPEVEFERGLELYVTWLRNRYPDARVLLEGEVDRNWHAPATHG